MQAKNRLPIFTIKETHKNGSDPAKSVSLEGVIAQMKDEGKFQIPQTIEVTSELAETEILLHMRQKGQVISGFPRRLKDDEDDGKLSRPSPFIYAVFLKSRPGVYEAVGKRHDPGLRLWPFVKLLLRRTSSEVGLSGSGSDLSLKRRHVAGWRKSSKRGSAKD
jgi:hypothetical protein